MADPVDMANDIVAEHDARAIAAAQAAVVRADPVIGFCEACADDDVMVLPCGGMPRCIDCRTKWERRR